MSGTGIEQWHTYKEGMIVTILQKEIAERNRIIETMGHMMAAGLSDITPENESAIQRGLTALLEVNEHAELMQQEAFEKYPWLKRAAEKAESTKVYYTYGSDERYPFYGGWVEVEADNMKQAHALYRAAYPDREPGILNCADYYTEEQFRRTGMMETGNRGAYCHRVIRA